MPTLKKRTDLLILFLLLFLPSLRAIFKYLPNPIIISVLFGSFLLVFYYIILSNKGINHLLNKSTTLKWVVSTAIVLIIVINFIVYPIADARKTIGKGSVSDDAIIEPVKQFISNGKLYDVLLYSKVPISPGPGWILLNTPFVIFNCYYLFTPFYIVVSIIVYLLLYRKKASPVIMISLLFSSLIFWDLMVTGHDLIAIGFSFALIVMLLFHYCLESEVNDITPSIILISIFIGIISTSRVVFIFLPFLIGILTFRFKPKQSIFIVLLSFTTAVALHLSFYLNSDYYQPFHLFNRGNNNVGMPLIITGSILTLCLLIAAYFKIRKSLQSILLWFFILIITPLSFISLGEFLSYDKRFALWEGANYLVPGIPVFLIYLSDKYAGLNKNY